MADEQFIHSVTIADPPPNPWARISEVAAKLGVAPRESGKPTIIATGADGKPYDVWEVVVAFLDRMEKT
jgi:hypothetical protein